MGDANKRVNLLDRQRPHAPPTQPSERRGALHLGQVHANLNEADT